MDSSIITTGSNEVAHAMSAFFLSFFGALMRAMPSGITGHVSLWEMPSNSSAHHPLTPAGLDAAANQAATWAGQGRDVYFAPGLRSQDLGPGRRGRKIDVVAVPGLWVDIDVADPAAHASTDLPLSEEAALEALASLDWLPRPTSIVRSGHGLHFYWLLGDGEAWWFADAADGEHAQRCITGFQARLRKDWERLGWHLDETASRDRVLRVPYTKNRKNPDDVRPVEIVADGGPTISRAWMQSMADHGGPRPPAAPAASEVIQPVDAVVTPRVRLRAGESLLDYVRDYFCRLERQPDLAEAARALLGGKPCAKVGSRNRTLFRLVGAALWYAVEVVPEIVSDDLIDLFIPSLEAMAREHNEEANPAPTVAEVEEMIGRQAPEVLAKRLTQWAAEDAWRAKSALLRAPVSAHDSGGPSSEHPADVGGSPAPADSGADMPVGAEPAAEVPAAEVPEGALHDGAVPAASAGGGAAADTAEWDPPLEFADHKVPAFPVASLPDWLRAFVSAVALSTQTPVDLAAILVLAVIATVCAKRVWVRVTPDWQEPTNLFAMVAAESGERKSAVFKLATAPLEVYEAQQASLIKQQAAAAMMRHALLEERVTQLKRLAARNGNQPPSAKNCKQMSPGQAEADYGKAVNDLAACKVPRAPRLLADDVTVEKLAGLMLENGGRMAILSPEGGVFGNIGGRYAANGASNFELYLKAHAGDSFRVDRQTRPPEFIDEAALTLGLAVQPSIIQSLADRPEFRGRGLCARFLYSMPASLVGRRQISPPPVPEDVRSAYNARVLGLLTVLGPEAARTILQLSPGALARLNEYRTELEPQLGRDGHLAALTDWANKLPGAIVRIAGLLHVAAGPPGAVSAEPISESEMICAIEIGRYLVPHARAAYNLMGLDQRVEDAKYVLGRISQAALTPFSARDLFEMTKARFRVMTNLWPVLNLLEAHNYLRTRPDFRSPQPGRKPSPSYEVNPLWLRPTTATCAAPASVEAPE